MKYLTAILAAAALAVSATLLGLYVRDRTERAEAEKVAAQSRANSLDRLLGLERRVERTLTTVRGLVPPPVREAPLSGTELERLVAHHLANLRHGIQTWHDRVRDPVETARAEAVMAASRDLITRLGEEAVPHLQSELVRVDESTDPEDGAPLIRSGYQTQVLQTLAELAPDHALDYLESLGSGEILAHPVLLQRDTIDLFFRLAPETASAAYVRLLEKAAPDDYNPDVLLRDLRHRWTTSVHSRLVAMLEDKLLDREAEVLHRNAAAKELQYHDSPESVSALKTALLDDSLDPVTTFPHALRSLDVLIGEKIVPYLDVIQEKNPNARLGLLDQLVHKYSSQQQAEQKKQAEQEDQAQPESDEHR